MIAFGPVPSRRLGKSLGINNIASRKVCSYSCVYCQIGLTKEQSITRTAFYHPEVLTEEVSKHLKKLKPNDQPDYLTFVTNGEPTLDIHLGEEIRLLKQFGIPIAVITNSSLINNSGVREELMEADWVSVKVDSTEELTWRRINQPVESLDQKDILNGIQEFAKSYKGKLHTETMLVAGINDDPGQINQTASFIAPLHPKVAYFSIPIRPPADKTVKAPDEEKLVKAWQIYSSYGIQVEMLAGFEGIDTGATGNPYDDILNITAVHPLREDALHELLRKNQAGIQVLQSLMKQGLILEIDHNGWKFYIRKLFGSPR
ncbi:MAG: radical SAM protein [Bacteroidales bacterium]